MIEVGLMQISARNNRSKIAAPRPVENEVRKFDCHIDLTLHRLVNFAETNLAARRLENNNTSRTACYL